MAAVTAAPAFAASSCDLSGLPGGGPNGRLKRFVYDIRNVEYVGSDGALGTASFWVHAVDRQTDAAARTAALQSVTALGCDASRVTWVDNATASATIDVQILRQEGGLDPQRFRTATLTSVDLDAVRYIDPTGAGGSATSAPYAIGKADYGWRLTIPSFAALYALNSQHRAYTSISAGDGGVSGGRIFNELRIDGSVRTFTNSGQGDTRF